MNYTGADYYQSVIYDYLHSNRDYPDDLFEDIVAFSKINLSSKLLEVGAGPGTATEGFTDYNIDVLEISKPQVSFLQNRYKEYKSRITIINTTFEEFQSAGSYDLIYSATAFHYINSKIGYPKAADLLNPGGCLALFWNLTQGVKGVGTYKELQDIEKEFGIDMLDDSDDLIGKTKFFAFANILSTKQFEDTCSKVYEFDRQYTFDDYLAWVKSRYYLYGEIETRRQIEYENEVRKIFDRYEGTINIRQYMILVMARKKGN